MAAKRIERLLEKATSPSLLEPDWETTFIFVDAVRSAEIPVKVALSSVKKRYHNENPHVSFYALCVLESLVKNCGDKVAKEVATKEYMEDLKHMAADPPADKVKNKVLELIACWARVFQKKQEFKIVQDTYNLMKMEGFEFPSVSESQAMFDAESAPEWKDATVCSRCNTGFSLIIRKHHCRNCGDIYCDKCSSKSKPLPHLGIDKEVRVCEGCFDLLSRSTSLPTKAGASSRATGDGPASKSSATAGESQAEKEKKLKEEKAKEEEELELALAISKSQAEEEERVKQRNLLHLYNGPDKQSNTPAFAYKGAKEESNEIATDKGSSDSGVEVPADNPELARYLNRGYWEQKRTEQKQSILRQSPTPSAPPPMGDHVTEQPDSTPVKQVVSNGILPNDKNDTSQFASELKKQMEVFVNRIKSDQGRGRSVVMDSSIQSLFLTLTNLHTQVLHRMHALDENRAHQESLQDKLAHIGDARQAVDALREEHRRQREAMLAEAQRQKQLQMQEKLGLMRQKKHEMLEHQRLMAVQRMQQHEAELARRRQMQAEITVPHTMYSQHGMGPLPRSSGYNPNVHGDSMHQPYQQQMAMAEHGGYAMPPGTQPAPYDMQGMQQGLPPPLYQQHPAHGQPPPHNYPVYPPPYQQSQQPQQNHTSQQYPQQTPTPVQGQQYPQQTPTPVQGQQYPQQAPTPVQGQQYPPVQGQQYPEQTPTPVQSQQYPSSQGQQYNPSQGQQQYGFQPPPQPPQQNEEQLLISFD